MMGVTCPAPGDLLKWPCEGESLSGIIVGVGFDIMASAQSIDRVVAR